MTACRSVKQRLVAVSGCMSLAVDSLLSEVCTLNVFRLLPCGALSLPERLRVVLMFKCVFSPFVITVIQLLLHADDICDLIVHSRAEIMQPKAGSSRV